MRVLFTVEEARHYLFMQYVHDLLKTKVGVALGHPTKILTVFIGETVEHQRGQLVHALTVGVLLVPFEKQEDHTGETIVVECLLFVFLLRQVDLTPIDVVFL